MARKSPRPIAKPARKGPAPKSGKPTKSDAEYWRARELRSRVLKAERDTRERAGDGEDYTRLATMKPLHPDDIRAMNAKAEVLRDRLLRRGARDALRHMGVAQEELAARVDAVYPALAKKPH